MAKIKSKSDWVRRHIHDPYVRAAQKKGYRSRAAFKLLEIQQIDKLFLPGMVVVDLGAAPGSWAQVVLEFIGPKGMLFALDALAFAPLPGVTYIQGDFLDTSVLQQLVSELPKDRAVDVVLSDLAPNITGLASTDQARSLALAEAAFMFMQQVLRPGGHMVIKIFQGSEAELFRETMKKAFAKVVVRKPKASRDESREIYLVGKGFKG